MDLLSQVLATIRARTSFVADLRLGGDVSLGIPHAAGVPFHYVIAGRCALVSPSQRVELALGDFVMMARSTLHRLETGNGASQHEISEFDERHNLPPNHRQVGLERPLLTKVGGDPPVARLLSGVMVFAGHENAPLTQDLPDILLLNDARTKLDPWLVGAIDFISAESSAPEAGFAAVANRLLELIVVGALRRWILSSDHERGWMRGLRDPFIYHALAALHAEPGRPWTLRQLAAMSGLSRSSFAERFRSVMGETPFAYLTQWRMHLASELLGKDDRSIPEIASTLGYGSSHAFAHAFFKELGETPARYRRRCCI